MHHNTATKSHNLVGSSSSTLGTLRSLLATTVGLGSRCLRGSSSITSQRAGAQSDGAGSSSRSSLTLGAVARGGVDKVGIVSGSCCVVGVVL